MRPTFEMLAFQLSKSWNIRVNQAKQSLGQLPLPLLYDPSIPIEKNRIYIAAATSLPAESSFTDTCCFVCCEGEPAALYNNSGCGLIVMEPSAPLIQVFNHIQCIYLLYQDWEENMQTLVGSTTSIQDLLDLSSIVLENPLLLTDDSNNILFSSYHGKPVPDEKPYLDVFMNEGTVHLIEQASRQLADRSYTFNLMQITGREQLPAVYFIKFFLGKIQIATLSMFPAEHLLQEHDKQLLEILALFVQIQLLRPPQLEGESLKKMVLSLLHGNPLAEEDTAILESALYYEPSDQYRCIVMKLPPDVLSKSGMYLQRRMKVEVPASISFLHDTCLVGLINETKSDWDREKFYLSMKYCLGNLDFPAGISDSFHQLADLKDYYRQAKAVLDFSAPGAPPMMTFMDCWEPYILTSCTNGLPPQMLFSSGFKRLIEYNETSSADYLETLRAYLEEGKNDSRAASRLFICRNSFLYRLEKLRNILDEDLRDANVCFRLMLCLRLYDFIQR